MPLTDFGDGVVPGELADTDTTRRATAERTTLQDHYNSLIVGYASTEPHGTRQERPWLDVR